MSKRPGWRRFTVDQVRKIRDSAAPVSELAATYSVGEESIRAIRSHRTYQYVDPHLKPEHRPRINPRGQVWCFECRCYLPADRFKWVTFPSLPKPKYYSYCRVCTAKRAYRQPYYQRGTEAWRRATKRRIENQRKQDRHEMRERIAFARDGVGLLRRRGFTKSEIARLCGVRVNSVLRWESGVYKRHGPTPAACRRIGVVLHETAGYRAEPTPAVRRCRPHPDLPQLMARVEPQLAAYPLRSRWRRREEAMAS